MIRVTNKASGLINTSIYFSGLSLAQVLKGTIVAEFDYFLWAFFVIQFFGSTIQGYISDLYRRSTVLNIALCVVIATVSILIFAHDKPGYLYHLLQLACIIAVGFGGNTDVVGRAGLIDIHYQMDRRRLLSWSVFVEAFGWVIIGLLIKIANLSAFNILVVCLIFSIFLLPISFMFNSDVTEDKKHVHSKQNLLAILKRKSKLLWSLILIILASELSYFFFFYSQEKQISKQNTELLSDSYLAWFIGMSFGCWALTKFKKYSDFLLLFIGLLISIFSIVLFACGGMKNISMPKMLYFDLIVYSVAGIGSGIYLPCFYTLISRGNSIHFQGFLTGLIDSLRVFGDAFSNIALLSIALSSSLPVLLSGALFAISIILLLLYRKNLILK